MSTSDSGKIEIVVGNFKADATLLNVGGTRTLRMRRGQTFRTAVRHVRNVMPGITLEAAEHMVRACKEFPDLDDMLGLNTPTPPSVERPPAEPTNQVDEGMRRKRRRRAALVAALLPALAASWALGRYTNVTGPASEESSASAPDVTADVAGADVTESASPFDDSEFQFFAGSSRIQCNSISSLEAECTDSDGMVMSTKAAVGPDSTIFTFSYGSERIGLRIFYDSAYADTWTRQDGSRELYPNMKVHDRYVLWGTDPKRIKEYMELLVGADHAAGPTAMGSAAPLPPRLAALTLGTLGLNRHDVDRLITRPAVATIDAPAIMAARLVLGLDTAPAPGVHEGEDIVALAAGIDPTPPASGAPGHVAMPVTQPSTDTTVPAAPVPAAPPKVPEGPATPSTPASPAEAPEASTPPAEETPAPAEPPAQETPAPPAEETPAPQKPQDPAPPAEETPPPSEPAPSEPEKPAPPAEKTPSAPPAQDPPAGETSSPPADAEAPEEPPAHDQDDAEDDLLISGSAWIAAS
ncbi:hypothetical protein [Streptomyces glaucus]|uniref:Uncharacterized protein n=1 Tax=Streptomyces glaucus TaxID=284029 RepID=A0ABN3JSJ5_9ACTN